MALVATTDAEQPRLRVAPGDRGEGDVGVGPPVDRDRLDHDRQLVGPGAQVRVQDRHQVHSPAVDVLLVAEELVHQPSQPRPQLVVALRLLDVPRGHDLRT